MAGSGLLWIAFSIEVVSVRHSPHERDVLQGVVSGRLNRQDPGIAKETVKVHRTRITTNLTVHSVASVMHLMFAQQPL